MAEKVGGQERGKKEVIFVLGGLEVKSKREGESSWLTWADQVGQWGRIWLAILPMQTSPDVGVAKLGSMTPGIRRSKKEDRIPQWGYDETKDFIALRAELEKDFIQTKRNKTLWEFIAGKMKEKGYRRSADQCKCKWKNLVNQYKVSSLF